MKKSILLVGLDLEPLMAEMDRLLTPEDDWAFVFAPTGKAAFDRLTVESFDAALVDVGLADLSGLQVLDTIKASHPQTMRFVYAPVSTEAAKLKHWGADHHLLLKPCSGQTLYSHLKRAFALLLWLPGKAAQSLVSNVQTFPSPPALYHEITRELQSPQGSMETVGELIARDPAMTVKVLRLANSAAFGLNQKVTDAGTAVMYLGAETVKSLILISGAFTHFEGFKPAGLSLEALWSHSFAVAQGARLIARTEKLRAEAAAASYTAGLLHDLGKLVLAVNLPDLFRQAAQLAQEHQIPAWKFERDLLGVSHAEVGAALLGLWGLPNEIVQAVAWHHQPSRTSNLSFCALTAVHVANGLAHETRTDEPPAAKADIDEDYLTRIGLIHRLPLWRDACQSD